MFKQMSKKTQQTNFVDQNTAIKGDIHSKGFLHFDGQLEGSLKVEGELVVGNGAFIKGNIFAKKVILDGYILGDVKAEIFKIRKTGRLEGNVETDSMEAEEGSIINGRVSLTKEETGKEKKEEALRSHNEELFRAQNTTNTNLDKNDSPVKNTVSEKKKEV